MPVQAKTNGRYLPLSVADAEGERKVLFFGPHFNQDALCPVSVTSGCTRLTSLQAQAILRRIDQILLQAWIRLHCGRAHARS